MNTAADHRSGPAPRHMAIRISASRMPASKIGFRFHTSANIIPLDCRDGEVRQPSGHVFRRLDFEESRLGSRAIFIEQAHLTSDRRHLVMHAKDIAAAFDD
jgi:hypothetical protein